MLTTAGDATVARQLLMRAGLPAEGVERLLVVAHAPSPNTVRLRDAVQLAHQPALSSRFW